MEARIEDPMVKEMQAEVQKGDFGGETLQFQPGGILIGLGGVPDVVEIEGEGGLPPGERKEVGVQVDVNTGWMAEGDFEGNVARRGLWIGVGRSGTCPYEWIGT